MVNIWCRRHPLHLKLNITRMAIYLSLFCVSSPQLNCMIFYRVFASHKLFDFQTPIDMHKDRQRIAINTSE